MDNELRRRTTRRRGFSSTNTTLELIAPDQNAISNDSIALWWINGTELIQSDICPGENWRIAEPHEYRKEARIIRVLTNPSSKVEFWWNDGQSEIKSADRPGKGWFLGRLQRNVRRTYTAAYDNYPKRSFGKWWHNPKTGERRRCRVCPGPGFEPGIKPEEQKKTGLHASLEATDQLIDRLQRRLMDAMERRERIQMSQN